MKKKLGLGTWSWGNKLFWGYNSSADRNLRETFNEALKRQFSFVDSADSYGTGQLNGRSEILIGEFTRGNSLFNKSKTQIATKLAPYPWRIGKKGLQNHFKIV